MKALQADNTASTIKDKHKALLTRYNVFLLNYNS